MSEHVADRAKPQRRLTVSLPADVAAVVKEAAEQTDRTVSGQIAHIVRQWAGERRRRLVMVSDEEFAALQSEVAELAQRDERGTVPPTLARLIERSYVG